MDLLSQHEAFLRAIFDAPDDDTPRLVYADFLQENGDENGEEDFARFIRLMIESERAAEDDPRRPGFNEIITELIRKNAPHTWRYWFDGRCRRGFDRADRVEIRVAQLEDVTRFRQEVVRRNPEWNGVRQVKVVAPPLLVADRVGTLLGLSVFKGATEWDFSRSVHQEVVGQWGDQYEYEAVEYPTIDGAGVEVLARTPAAGRITDLIFAGNNLDDAAALALVRSPYLDNLKRLCVRPGNRVGEAVWQKVVARFGEGVVQ
jgi:uncharacterized protein (TIGR02996 family)